MLVAEVHDNEFINNGELVVECRVLEGEHDGKLLWIAAHEIAEYTVAVFDPQKDFDALADKAFQIADAIERSGRKGTAFKRYREIVTLYDGTDGAFKARARMKKLDPSPPTPSEKAATEKAASNAFRAAKALESRAGGGGRPGWTLDRCGERGYVRRSSIRAVGTNEFQRPLASPPTNRLRQ